MKIQLNHLTNIFTIFALVCTMALPVQAYTQTVHESLRWILSMKNEQDMVFSARDNRLSRMSMLVEMGQKHPAVNCTADCDSNFDMNRCLRHCNLNSGKNCPTACDSAKKLKNEACHLGLVGATYYLTGFQEITKRSEELIWHGPNASLNIEAYAYMKERELGISCDKSVFIGKFPTRRPLPGESQPPILRHEVCAAWNEYFAAAGTIARNRVDGVLGYSEQSGLTYEVWLNQISQERRTIDNIQSIMWKAHTFAILHAYWQSLHRFKRSSQMHIPAPEYAMWMGWNKLVGGIIPELNLNSCVGSAEFLAYQLMPNCVVGEVLLNGRICKGTAEPGASIFGSIKSEVFHQMQSDRASHDFIEAIEAFSSPMEAHRKIPYQWPTEMREPFSFNRAR
ncbi:MAG: hypothetical protein ACK5WZ_07965 [Pseudobdellovibrionaceae bacterium]